MKASLPFAIKTIQQYSTTALPYVERIMRHDHKKLTLKDQLTENGSGTYKVVSL